jgi:predicted flavoprotein YhiN
MAKRFVVIGGGAAGFFAAVAAAEANPEAQVVLLEKSAQFLGKVRISEEVGATLPMRALIRAI